MLTSGYIHSWGTCSSFDDSESAFGRVKTISDLESIPRSMKRKMGKLSKIMYSAVKQAIKSVNLPDEFPLAVGTAYGEIDMGIGILEDIYESRGTLLRPIRVQNSVHVSSSGYLGILLENQGPTLTISQGKLTTEATLDALLGLMGMTNYPYGVMVVGDLFSSEWSEKLKDHAPSYGTQLTEVPHFESAAALVISRNKSESARENWKISGQVQRLPLNSCESREWYKQLGESIAPEARLFTRGYALWEDKDFSTVQEYFGRDIEVTNSSVGLGTSMSGALEIFISHIPKSKEDTLVLLSREYSELGTIRCDRVSGS